MANVSGEILQSTSWPKLSMKIESDIWVISDETMSYVYTINLAIVCGFWSIFGIVTNTINILVFCRIGFHETINISLLGLALSDLFSLIALMWVSICYNPFFLYSDLPVSAIDLQHLPGGWTHVIFTRVTGFITVFITLERCLCIAFPLKIRHIVTPFRVKIIISCIFIVIVCSMVPNYFGYYLGWRWVPSKNRTILTIGYLELRDSFENISYYVQMIYPIFSFSSVVTCTAIFAWKLNQRGKWLQSATTGQEKTSSVRDKHVIKMVVCVATIFIVCYIPSLLLFTVLSSIPEMNYGRKYQNLFIMITSIAFPLEAINSSVNIFVYYRMMSKYKTTFHSMCSLGCQRSDPDK